MTKPKRQILANLFITIGLAFVLGEVILHVVAAIVPTFDYEINEFVILVAAVLGFWGFWQKDPVGTERGTKVLVDLAVRLNPLRRSTDRRPTGEVAVQAEVTRVEVVEPAPSQDTGDRRRHEDVVG